MNVKKSLKDVIVLVAICVVFAAILAATNSITGPIIADRLNSAADEAYLAVMPDATGFEEIDLSAYELPATVTDARREKSGMGYAIKLETRGYDKGLIIIVGVSADGVVTGATCIASNETNGAENSYGASFEGKDKDGAGAVDLVSGSTLTSTAYRNAVVDAINAATILGGGSVDIRTDEQILADNLAAALPAGEGAFTKIFLVEVVEGVDKIYTADNGAGCVIVIGDKFIGVDSEGNALNVVDSETNPVLEGIDELKATAESAVTIVSATETTDVDLTAYEGIHARVISVKKTTTGNYIVELKCDGFGIHGDEYYMPSGEDYFIQVSLSADGKIIDAQTIRESETDTVGGAQLKDGAYNSNFIGKTQAEASEVDTVSDCTLTTNAYKKAILRAFETVTIIEGGAENE